LEEFDFDHARSLKRDTIAHLGALDFVTARENVVFPVHPLPPPTTGGYCQASAVITARCAAAAGG
jgi:hypothetical protein